MSEAAGGPQPDGAPYSAHFSRKGFRKRAKGYLRRAGREVGEREETEERPPDEPGESEP